MATGLTGAKATRVIVDEAYAADDGLQEFAIFADRDLEADTYRITKIAPFDHNTRYPVACVGVVRAKDELDAWRFAKSYVEDQDRWYQRDRPHS